MDEQYLMAFDENEEAIGLLRDTESGLFARSQGRWFTITEENPAFDGAQVVQVDDDFLDFYDRLDSKGNEPTYKQAQSYAVEDEVDETEEAEEE